MFLALARLVGVLALALGACVSPASAGDDDDATGATRRISRHPLDVQIPGGGRVESCADPSIIHGPVNEKTQWYIYCTTDPLNDLDKNASGGFNFHLIPTLRSADLIHWTYAGDVFSTRPSWVASDAGLWAPDIQFFNGQYFLYYTAQNTNLPGGGSAIGVATAPSPTGPWTDSGGPVVEPHAAACCPASRRWVYDPALIQDDSGQRFIYYGSYFGGVSVRKLSADGLHSDPASQTQVTIANRYEGTFVVKHGGFYYLFGSATNCCNGPLTGYSVFAGRSTSPLGPFVDREGVSLLAGRVGGTPVISMTGDRWVGPGHNAVFTDLHGQDWFLYHAVDRDHPYFAGPPGFTKRPALMDRLDWVDGWPRVTAGQREADEPGELIASLSDEFNTATLKPQWSWVRQPASGTYGLQGGFFRFDTQAADLYVDSNNASVLTEATPSGDYLVETRLNLNVPAEGCCQNFVQAGLVIYGDDDNFIKLAQVSIFETRQTEFAKELKPVPAGFPRYGNTVVGPPGDWTYLRLAVRRAPASEERFTAYTSRDGRAWVHGGTWTHQLGASARIGLVAMGGSGFSGLFDYVRVYHLEAADREAEDR